MDSDKRDIVIGKIVAPFGRKGEAKVVPFTDFPERFKELGEVYVGSEAAGGMRSIQGARLHKGSVLIKFEGIDNITAAEALRGAEIRIRESDLLPLEEGTYYIHDLIGLDVLTTEGENLGKVKEVLTGPAQDVYVTERAMIPAVKEFVVSIDLQKKQIVVNPIEGLVQE